MSYFPVIGEASQAWSYGGIADQHARGHGCPAPSLWHDGRAHPAVPWYARNSGLSPWSSRERSLRESPAPPR
jgi:hypothetical protein